jgi:hypothetical protein
MFYTYLLTWRLFGVPPRYALISSLAEINFFNAIANGTCKGELANLFYNGDWHLTPGNGETALCFSFDILGVASWDFYAWSLELVICLSILQFANLNLLIINE